jgi:arsenite methyltransferase
MTSRSIVTIALNEILRQRSVERQPEPDLVMNKALNVKAYVEAGRELGVLKPVYLFHAAQISEILRPGDHAIDLACGPATLLCMVAKMNPEVHFTGFDLSNEMLGYARQYAQYCGIGNVEFRRCDITDLACLDPGSANAVFSTLALHHLPDVPHLERTFSEIDRVLEQNGSVYLLDFGLLKTETAIKEFAYQYADAQPEVFTMDYYHSLHAAFPAERYRMLTEKHLSGRARTYFSFPVPYNVAVKGEIRCGFDKMVVHSLAEYARRLTGPQKEDIRGLRISFGLGGLRSRLLDKALAEDRRGEVEPALSGTTQVPAAITN